MFSANSEVFPSASVEDADRRCGEHARLARGRALDPRLEIVVADDRYAVLPVANRGHGMEPMGVAVGGVGVRGNQCAKPGRLRRFAVARRAVETTARRPELELVRRLHHLKTERLHHASTRAQRIRRRPTGVRFSRTRDVKETISSPPSWPGFRSRKNRTCGSA